MGDGEWFIQCGQTWRSPTGETIEIGIPHFFGTNGGSWVRRNGRAQTVSDETLDALLVDCVLVSSRTSDEWRSRPGTTFYD